MNPVNPVNPLRALRQGAAARLARLVDFRIDDRMRGHVERIERHAGRLAEQERRVADPVSYTHLTLPTN